MKEKRRENWNYIEEEADKHMGIPIIIGRDVNARTAEEEDKLTEHKAHRINKDKVRNREGGE